MAARKNNPDFTATIVPELPAAAQTTASKSLPKALGNKATAKVNLQLAQAQAELKAAKAQLAAANKALASIRQDARGTDSKNAKNITTSRPSSNTADGEDLQFKVELPEKTVASVVKDIVKKAVARPKAIKIDLDGDHAKVAAQPCDAGNRLANPAALACGDYLHGEIDPEEVEATEVDKEIGTFMHQGVVFNLSPYASAAVASAIRRLGGFAIDVAITILLSFVFMSSAQTKYWINFARDLHLAFNNWLDSPIFQLGYVIETVAHGQMQDLSLNLDLFSEVFRSYLPLLDLKGVVIFAVLWTVSTSVAIGFWDSTLGQKLLHLKIVHVHRDHFGWPWAFLRQAVYVPLSIVSVIGVVMGLLGSKRCWQDYLSGSKVTLF